MSSDKQFSSKSLRMLNTEDQKEMSQIEKQCVHDHSNDADYSNVTFQSDSPLINVPDNFEKLHCKVSNEKKKKRLKTFQKYQDHNYSSKLVTFGSEQHQSNNEATTNGGTAARRSSRVEQSDTQQISSQDYFASFEKFEFISGKAKQRKLKEKKLIIEPLSPISKLNYLQSSVTDRSSGTQKSHFAFKRALSRELKVSESGFSSRFEIRDKQYEKDLQKFLNLTATKAKVSLYDLSRKTAKRHKKKIAQFQDTFKNSVEVQKRQHIKEMWFQGAQRAFLIGSIIVVFKEVNKRVQIYGTSRRIIIKQPQNIITTPQNQRFFHPNSLIKQVWDIFISFLLIYTAIMVPY